MRSTINHTFKATSNLAETAEVLSRVVLMYAKSYEQDILREEELKSVGHAKQLEEL